MSEYVLLLWTPAVLATPPFMLHTSYYPFMDVSVKHSAFEHGDPAPRQGMKTTAAAELATQSAGIRRQLSTAVDSGHTG